MRFRSRRVSEHVGVHSRSVRPVCFDGDEVETCGAVRLDTFPNVSLCTPLDPILVIAPLALRVASGATAASVHHSDPAAHAAPVAGTQ